ncbi:MAG: helix-turn-helix domain-containing protein [Cypionkella sp.]|nr:helix-turn-helix domain-containing protein [Cypionkella sp.]
MLLSDKAVADKLGVSRSTIRRWAKELPGFPQPVKIADATRWQISEVEEWITSLAKAGK